MKKIVFIKWAMSLLFLSLFVACGGGSSGVDTTVTTTPQVSSDTSGNMVVSGSINLSSGLASADNVSSVVLNGLRFVLPSNQNCTVLSTTLPDSVDVTSNSDVSFETVLSEECYNINNMTLSATESIVYSNGATQAKDYTYLVTYDNSEILNSYDKLDINVNIPTVVNLDDNASFTYQLTDNSTNTQLSDTNTQEVKVETSDSSKLIFTDSSNSEVNSITTTNAPYKQISFKGVSSGTASITVTATATINGFTIKKSKTNSLTIGGANNSKYEITISLSNSFSVDQEQLIGVDIVEQGSDTNFISDNNVKAVNLSLKNDLLYFNDNIDDYTYNYDSSSRKNIDLHTKTISGVEILHISADIYDGENYVTIEKDFPITIISGVPSSISIVYKASAFDTPFFYDTYIVHAVDKYGNPAREGSKIYLGAINGLVKDSSDNELYVNNGGSISSNNYQTEFTLTNSTFDFSNVESRDSVVVLATKDKMNPSYLGGWIVDSVEDSKTLLFGKQYSGVKTDGLTFVVGNEKRYDICEKEPKLVDFDSSDDSYLLGSGGMKEIRLRYPPYMVGKDVYLYVNSYDENRTGVAIREKLWGTGVNASINSAGCVAGNNCDITAAFTVSGSNGPLKNMNFSLGNFIIGSGCSNVVMTKSNTDCDGQIVINVDYADGCSIEWDNSLSYEH